MLDKILALEAKTVERGCTPEEAAAAQVKARELRKKYHITATRSMRLRIRMEPDNRTVYDNDTDRWVHVPGGWIPPYTYGVVHTNPVTGRPDATVRDVIRRGRRTWHDQ